MPFLCSLGGVKKDKQVESERFINLSANDKLDQQIKTRSTNRK